MKKPRIKISNLKVDHSFEKEKLQEQIRCQNNIQSDDHFHIELVRNLEDRHCFTIFAEGNSNLLKKNVQNFQKDYFLNGKAYENNFIAQYKNCFRFNGSFKKCINSVRCQFCGENHENISCNNIEKLKYGNCIQANSMLKTIYVTEHLITDRNCSRCKFHLKRFLSEVDSGV